MASPLGSSSPITMDSRVAMSIASSRVSTSVTLLGSPMLLMAPVVSALMAASRV